MPVISVTMGQVAPDARRQLIATLSAQASEITRIPVDKFIVFINELADPCIGVGGKPLDVIKKEA